MDGVGGGGGGGGAGPGKHSVSQKPKRSPQQMMRERGTENAPKAIALTPL